MIMSRHAGLLADYYKLFIHECARMLQLPLTGRAIRGVVAATVVLKGPG